MPTRSDGRITGAQREEAMRVLRADYYQSVRSVAHDLASEVKNGSITSQDEWETAINQAVDGTEWVIYTQKHFQVLFCSDNHNAYVENYGQAPVEGDDINWAALAFAALEADVRQQIEAEGLEPNWDELREGSRMHARNVNMPPKRRG